MFLGGRVASTPPLPADPASASTPKRKPSQPEADHENTYLCGTMLAAMEVVDELP
jgi:hypothetical protein